MGRRPRRPVSVRPGSSAAGRRVTDRPPSSPTTNHSGEREGEGPLVLCCSGYPHIKMKYILCNATTNSFSVNIFVLYILCTHINVRRYLFPLPETCQRAKSSLASCCKLRCNSTLCLPYIQSFAENQPASVTLTVCFLVDPGLATFSALFPLLLTAVSPLSRHYFSSC